MTPPELLSVWCLWQNQRQLGLSPGLQGERIVSGSLARTTVPESATWAWACLFKTALLGLGLHWYFTISYLYTKGPTKALYSIDGCKLLLLRGGQAGTLHLPSYWPLFCFLIFVSIILWLLQEKVIKLFFFFAIVSSSLLPLEFSLWTEGIFWKYLMCLL